MWLYLKNSFQYTVGANKCRQFHLYEVPKSQIPRVRKYLGRCRGLGEGGGWKMGQGAGDLVFTGDRVSV